MADDGKKIPTATKSEVVDEVARTLTHALGPGDHFTVVFCDASDENEVIWMLRTTVGCCHEHLMEFFEEAAQIRKEDEETGVPPEHRELDKDKDVH